MLERVELKERLREAMEMRGMRAVDLVEQTGIPKGTISYYLSGKTEPKADRLYILAQVLNINEAWLLGYDVPKERSAERMKNDQLAKLVARMKRDDRFYNMVAALSNLTESQYRSIEQLIATFNEKP